VGHRQLLIRSPKTASLPTRVDILFKNVAAIHIPTTMDALTILEATKQEADAIDLQLGSSTLQGQKVFWVQGSKYAGYVIAGSISWHEDQGEYHDPSHFHLRPGVAGHGVPLTAD
jgi:hypothetical protein